MTNEIRGAGIAHQQLLEQVMKDPGALVSLQDPSIPLPQKAAVPNLVKSKDEKAFDKKDRLGVRDQNALLRAANNPKKLEKCSGGKWQLSQKVQNAVKDTLSQNAMYELTGEAVGEIKLKDSLQQKGMHESKPKEGLKRAGAFKTEKK